MASRKLEGASSFGPGRSIRVPSAPNVVAHTPNPLPPVNPALAQPGAAMPFPNVYDPPFALPAPLPPGALSQGTANGYELGSAQINCLQIGGTTSPTVVYSTSKRWAGCDVYITTDFVGSLGNPYITVQVYAVSRSTGRSLVASGRTRSTGTFGALRIAAARAIADTFDVVISKSGGPVDARMIATVTVVASDDLDALTDVETFDFMNGVISPLQAGATSAPELIIAASPAVPVQLVGLRAQNTVATARWLQVWDSAAVLGGFPRQSFLLPANGDLFVDSPALRSYRYWEGCYITPSTSPGSYVAPGVGDVIYDAYFR